MEFKEIRIPHSEIIKKKNFLVKSETMKLTLEQLNTFCKSDQEITGYFNELRGSS